MIHPSAIISDGAKISDTAQIGPYSIIGPHVVVGDNTRVHSHVVIDGHTTIGAGNEIFPFACIGTAPQDLKYDGEPSTLQIGDRNKIRESVTIQPGTRHGLMRTIVGSGNLFMANAHVGHDCTVGDNNVFANSVGLAGHVTVEDYVILGGMAGVHQFCRLGALSFISGGTMVGLDIPPFTFAQGDRCSIRGLNLVGLQRAGFSSEDISAVKKTYRHLFSTVGHLKEKIECLPEDISTNLKVQKMLTFIAGSERGITMPARSKPAGDA
jgi:UDP-N-acetylglucosamine acyltransferase